MTLWIKLKMRKQSRPSFLKSFKDRNWLKARFANQLSNSLMIDPERDIVMAAWEDEVQLREKADIHRARLNRFGRSKINGEMIFLESTGCVYKRDAGGDKYYI